MLSLIEVEWSVIIEKHLGPLRVKFNTKQTPLNLSEVVRVRIPAEPAYRYAIPAGGTDTGMIPVSCCHFWHHTKKFLCASKCTPTVGPTSRATSLTVLPSSTDEYRQLSTVQISLNRHMRASLARAARSARGHDICSFAARRARRRRVTG